MKRAFFLVAAAALAGACRSRRATPVPAASEAGAARDESSYEQTLAGYKDPGPKAEEPAPKQGTWSAELDAVVAKGLTMPSPPLAYAYHGGSDPRLLADNIGNAAKFIAYSLRYQEAAAKVPTRFWTDADKAALEQNKVLVEKARRILKDDADRLTR